jgi:hypothetical protein
MVQGDLSALLSCLAMAIDRWHDIRFIGIHGDCHSLVTAHPGAMRPTSMLLRQLPR